MVRVMRILCFGGRHYANRAAIARVLGAIHRRHGITCLIDGACPSGGADRLSHEWAVERGIPTERYPVNHLFDGPWPAAGPERNARMLAWSRPDAAVGFPGGRGTADMARRAVAALGETKVWRPLG